MHSVPPPPNDKQANERALGDLNKSASFLSQKTGGGPKFGSRGPHTVDTQLEGRRRHESGDDVEGGAQGGQLCGRMSQRLTGCGTHPAQLGLPALCTSRTPRSLLVSALHLL